MVDDARRGGMWELSPATEGQPVRGAPVLLCEAPGTQLHDARYPAAGADRGLSDNHTARVHGDIAGGIRVSNLSDLQVGAGLRAALEGIGGGGGGQAAASSCFGAGEEAQAHHGLCVCVPLRPWALRRGRARPTCSSWLATAC